LSTNVVNGASKEALRLLVSEALKLFAKNKWKNIRYAVKVRGSIMGNERGEECQSAGHKCRNYP